MSREISLSFIVPSKNEAKVIGRCLRSIERICEDADEIIVIDNQSTDGTADIARHHARVEMLSSDAATVAGVRNEGARRARGSVLVFIDADCVVGVGWRTALVSALADTQVVATGGGLTFPEDGTWVEKAWMCGWAAPSGPVRFISTANLAVRRKAFEELRGFDESLETDEDTDFCRRVRSTFGSPALLAKAGMTVVHLGSARTVVEHWRRQYWHSAGMLASVAKHGPDRAFYMTLLFSGLHVLGLGALVLLPMPSAAATFTAAVLVIPLVTALYRLRRLGCLRWLPQLVVLYAIFYYARCFRLMKLATKARVLPGSLSE